MLCYFWCIHGVLISMMCVFVHHGRSCNVFFMMCGTVFIIVGGVCVCLS